MGHSPPVNEIPGGTVSNLLNEGGMATSLGHVARGFGRASDITQQFIKNNTAISVLPGNILNIGHNVFSLKHLFLIYKNLQIKMLRNYSY